MLVIFTYLLPWCACSRSRAAYKLLYGAAHGRDVGRVVVMLLWSTAGLYKRAEKAIFVKRCDEIRTCCAGVPPAEPPTNSCMALRTAAMSAGWWSCCSCWEALPSQKIGNQNPTAQNVMKKHTTHLSWCACSRPRTTPKLLYGAAHGRNVGRVVLMLWSTAGLIARSAEGGGGSLCYA